MSTSSTRSTRSTRYPYVHVDVPAEDADVLSAELFELGASGLEERDATTLLKSPSALSSATPSVTLIASFDDERAAELACAALAPRFPARIEHVEGDAWRDGWRQYFKPTRVGDRLVVKPSWEAYEPSATDLVLTLDPANAFGTGTHETTQLVLAQLEGLVLPEMRVLDVGTGSGILAIACCLLGASHVRALDIDDESVRACQENAAVNGVAGRIEVDKTQLSALQERYPLVLANIETRILVPLRETLLARLAPGGTLVLSGILRSELETARQAYAELALIGEHCAGEWAALVLQQASEPRP